MQQDAGSGMPQAVNLLVTLDKAQLLPICLKCQQPVDPCTKGTRLVGKQPPTFKCSQCCTKQVQLSQLFGSWPIPEFTTLSDHEQTKFWREGVSGKQNLKSSVEQILLKKQVDEEHAAIEGPFLPLTVWAQQGYDTDRIAAKAKMEMQRWR